MRLKKNGHEYDSQKISILDVNMIEKQRLNLPTYGIRPIWRWFYLSARKKGLDIEFVEYKHNLYQSSGDFQYLKSVYLIATRDLSNLWLQFFYLKIKGLCDFLRKRF